MRNVKNVAKRRQAGKFVSPMLFLFLFLSVVYPLVQYVPADERPDSHLPGYVQTPATATDGLSIGKYVLLTKKQITRTEYEFTYTAVVTNSGAAATNVTATLTSADPNTKVVDGTLNFGNVGAGNTKLSNDTFTIRQNRTVEFDWANLSWDLYYDVTPVPTPVANAGPDQPVTLNATVTLDGSGSSGQSGTLYYAWKFVSMPENSNAALSDATKVRPWFVVDEPGEYEIELAVSDDGGLSLPDRVKITVGVAKPVANAGPGQRVNLRDTVQLDGSGSTDPNGLSNLLYQWTFVERPNESNATLGDSSIVNPTFLVDRPGLYKLALVVYNGYKYSDPDFVEISTNTLAPVANAGDDQYVAVGAKVELDGGGSSDPQNLELSYSWTFMSKPTAPEASMAALEGVNTRTPSFVADVHGDYTVKLVVSNGELESDPDTVLVSTNIVKPVAVASKLGDNPTTYIEVTLDGSGSYDPQNYGLTYQWSVNSQPSGSDVMLSAATYAQPKFYPVIPGTYVFQLVVGNGKLLSDAVTVSFEVAVLTVNVPNLDGRTKKEAETELGKQQLVPGLVRYLNHPTAPSGTVIPQSQNPANGATALAGSSVSFDVSLGIAEPILVSVPSVVGISQTEAEQMIASAGLASDIITHLLVLQPDGKVFSQLPEAGTKVAPGTTINLNLARRPSVEAAMSGGGKNEPLGAERTLSLTIPIGGEAEVSVSRSELDLVDYEWRVPEINFSSNARDVILPGLGKGAYTLQLWVKGRVETSWDGPLSGTIMVTESTPLSDEKEITSFKLGTLTGVIDQNAGTINFKTLDWIDNLYSMEAEFTATGAVTINGVPQNNGVTKNDFHKNVIYTVTAENGSSRTYTVHVKSPQTTGLPIVKIDTKNRETISSKEIYLNTDRIAVIDPEHPKWELESTDPLDGVRGRGNATWNYDKKPYRIKFNKKKSLFGLTAAKSWVLLADYKSPTALQNATAFELGQRFNFPYANHYKHVELVLNGEYKGMYILTEQVQVGEGRVNIDENNGFLVEMDFYFDEDPKFRTTNFNLPVMIKSPELEDISGYDFVKEHVNELADAVAASSFPANNWRDLIDVDKLIDFLMINDIVMNFEVQVPASIYLSKDVDKKIIMGPLWDFDCGYGYEEDTFTFYREYEGRVAFLPRRLTWYGSGQAFFQRFFKDPDFVSKYKARWNEMYPLISDMKVYIENMAEYLQDSRELNCEKWQDSYTYYGALMGASDSISSSCRDTKLEGFKSWWDNRVNYLNTDINK